VALIRRLFGDSDRGDDEDAKIVARLEHAGVDLSTPITLTHRLSLPDERMARQVVAKLANTGGTVTMAPPLLGARWTVQVTFPMVVTEERLASIRAQLGAFAAEHGGEYVGWVAADDPGRSGR
jgi:Regulator of ribonuclease activity B